MRTLPEEKRIARRHMESEAARYDMALSLLLRGVWSMKWSIGLFSTAIGLFAVHGLFHLWEWLWWPPPDALSALYGATDVGRLAHAVTEVIIALALFLGLWYALRDWALWKAFGPKAS